MTDDAPIVRTSPVSTLTTASATLTTPPLVADAFDDDVCRDRTPVRHEQIGTVNTIVVPENADDFDVVVVAEPRAACPGDTVRFAVTVTNVADTSSVFAPNRGLLFASGMMANWELGYLGNEDLAPGEAWDTVVVGVIPPVREGVYSIRPEGISASGTVTVLDPVTARDGES
ncbi:MAG: hypothetical protein ACR2O6_12000 [Ilumatobacteraceae bacterium]